MDWQALWLSVELALATLLVLTLPALGLARWLARTRGPHKVWIEAAVLMPLVLPPTVLGYYLLVGVGGQSWIGQWLSGLGLSLTFNFAGLVLASVVFNIPFMVQPMQRAFESVPGGLREAGLTCGLSPLEVFWRIELPLIWPGVLSALVILVFFAIYSASGIVAGARLFESTFGLPYQSALWAGAAVTIAYTLIGGFLAVSWTDTVQGTLMILALLITPVVVIVASGGKA